MLTLFPIIGIAPSLAHTFQNPTKNWKPSNHYRLSKHPCAILELCLYPTFWLLIIILALISIDDLHVTSLPPLPPFGIWRYIWFSPFYKWENWSSEVTSPTSWLLNGDAGKPRNAESKGCLLHDIIHYLFYIVLYLNVFIAQLSSLRTGTLYILIKVYTYIYTLIYI